MGLHAPTCEVVFEYSRTSHWRRRIWFGAVYNGMLNGARMGCSAGVGMATAHSEEAKIFASTRIQFGKPIEEIPQ